jgi:hypothetical protein
MPVAAVSTLLVVGAWEPPLYARHCMIRSQRARALVNERRTTKTIRTLSTNLELREVMRSILGLLPA